MCLQQIIDEILLKKSGKTYHDAKHKIEKLPFLTRNKSLINKQDEVESTEIKTSRSNQGEIDLFENDNFISTDDL